MPTNLNHLSEAEIETLMQRYYAGETVSKLLKEYHLSVRPAELFRLFPREICKDKICEYCKEHLVRDRLSKTASTWWRSNSDIYCPVCNHRPYANSCRCGNCVDKERVFAEHQRVQIQKMYSQKRTPVDFFEISFEQKVYLGALCRALCKENLFEIRPYIYSNAVLAPTIDLVVQIYKSLHRDGIIAVSPTSSTEAFDVNADDFPNTYYVDRVTYYLNLVFPPNRQELFDEILNPTYYSPKHRDDALALWRKIAVGECLEYLVYRLQNVGFAFNPGDKTCKMFDILLNDFSVSQIYGIIWRAVSDVSKLYLEKGISKIYAANCVIGACERNAERAKMNGWVLTEYHRIKDLPQSALSSFFFNRVLGIGDKGFTLPPTKV